ncbi:MAG TPA: hypothetical protein VFS63_08245 [Pseudolabrys sp.]|nr:hypothetical protein [Pseudolabrys sp.]
MHRGSTKLGRALCAAAIALFFVSAAAMAQQGHRIRGQIEKIDGQTMSLKLRDGSTLTVHMNDHTRVGALNKASLADIKNDTFIGVAGMPKPDGSIEAFSIHIFMASQRGKVPDRHGPWDARPGSTMTNAYVESSVAGKSGETLMVKYQDGEKKIIVTPTTAIAAVAPGNKGELKAGTQIIIMAADKEPDGSVLAKTLYLGRDLTPAM